MTFIIPTTTIGLGGMTLAASDSCFVVAGVTLGATQDDAIYCPGTDNRISIAGTVSGYKGIFGYSNGAANDIRIAVTQTGTIYGDIKGIHLMSTGNAIDNAGTILGGTYGIAVGDFRDANNPVNLIKNSGEISGFGAGIVADAGTLKIINYGMISDAHSDSYAIFMAGDQLQLNNVGTVSGLIYCANAATITNAGLIDGNVQIDGDNGAVDTHKGTISGTTTFNGAHAVFQAGAGEDVAIAASSDATLSFVHQTVALSLSLDGSLDATGWALGDSYTGFANIAGSLVAANTLTGDANDNMLTGGAKADTLSGGAGADTLIGGAGADKLYGGDGNDTLRGGGGADILYGGVGSDTLTGNGGADKFVFKDGDFGTAAAGWDRITDFSHAQGDKIDLSGVDANTTISGDQAFTFIGNAAFGRHAGELRYDSTDQFHGDTALMGDTNGDGTADFVILLAGTQTPVAADIVL